MCRGPRRLVAEKAFGIDGETRMPAGMDRPDKAIGRSERDFNNRKCFRLKLVKSVFDEQWEGKEKETKGLPLAAPYSHFKFSLFAHMHMSDFDLHVFTRPCQC